MTPRQSIETECARRGEAAVVRACVALLDGRVADDDLLFALGGPASHQVLDGREGGKAGYWPRVWAARGLLYAWDDGATDAVVRALADLSWRVREMAAKVVARHRIDDAFDAILGLRNDPQPRVRAAAHRAIEALTTTLWRGVVI